MVIHPIIDMSIDSLSYYGNPMASPKRCRQVKSESKLVIVHSSTTFRAFLYLIDTWDSSNWVPRTPLVNHHYPYLNGYVGQSASWQRGCKRRMSKKSVHTHSTLRHATAHSHSMSERLATSRRRSARALRLSHSAALSVCTRKCRRITSEDKKHAGTARAVVFAGPVLCAPTVVLPAGLCPGSRGLTLRSDIRAAGFDGAGPAFECPRRPRSP